MSKRLRRVKYLKEIDSAFMDREVNADLDRIRALLDRAIVNGDIYFNDIPGHIRAIAGLNAEICRIRTDVGRTFYYVYRQHYALDEHGRRYDIHLG